MDKFDVSVVIPLYNKENYIRRCLESVLKQTVMPKEVIIINDGSTDASASIARKCLAGSLIKSTVYDFKNGGVSAARNTGIRLAKGKYIALLDGDDEWKPGYLEKIKYLFFTNFSF